MAHITLHALTLRESSCKGPEDAEAFDAAGPATLAAIRADAEAAGHTFAVLGQHGTGAAVVITPNPAAEGETPDEAAVAADVANAEAFMASPAADFWARAESLAG